MKLLENLKWRYATKKFDPIKKVSEKELELLKQAIHLSASSYGLQLYKVLIIENKILRDKLKIASWEQDQVSDASHLFVFCIYTEVKDIHVDEFIALLNRANGFDKGIWNDYGNFIKGKLALKSASEQRHWMSCQTYIALGSLLMACAELRIDACPMEGFEPDMYDNILGLKEKGLQAAVIAAVGYRSLEDRSQVNRKIRKPIANLFECI